MKATIYLSEDDLKAMFIERWAPRTDRYPHNGPEPGRPVRISELSIYPTGGWVEFTDEAEPPKAEPPEPFPSAQPPEIKKEDPDDLLQF